MKQNKKISTSRALVAVGTAITKTVQARLTRKKSTRVGQDFLHNKTKKPFIERLLT